MDMATILALTNLILALILAVSQFKVSRLLPKKSCFRWIKIASGCLGVYWAVVYVYVLFTDPATSPINSVLFGQIFIRPAITVTLAVMSAGALLRSKCD